MSGRGPVRARTFVFTSVAVMTIEKFIGRNASPVSSGVMPMVFCR